MKAKQESKTGNGMNETQPINEFIPSDINELSPEQYSAFTGVNITRFETIGGIPVLAVMERTRNSAATTTKANKSAKKKFAAESFSAYSKAKGLIASLEIPAKAPYHPCTVSMLNKLRDKLNRLNLVYSQPPNVPIAQKTDSTSVCS